MREDFTGLTSTRKNFISFIKSIDENVSGSSLVDIIDDMIPPARLLAIKICDLLSI